MLAISVCVVTLVVHGLTLKPLTQLSGIAEGPDRERREAAIGGLALANAALSRAEERVDADTAPPAVLSRLIDSLTERREDALQRVATLEAPDPKHIRFNGNEYRELRRDLLRAEARALSGLVSSGVISDSTGRALRHTLDLEEAALGAQDR